MNEQARITFDDCCSELLGRGAKGGQRALDRWTQDTRFAQVVPFVREFTHEHLFSLGADAVMDVISRSTHALGDVQTDEQLPLIENFSAPFALQHLFHWYVEENKSLPVWSEFRDWMVCAAQLLRSGTAFSKNFSENPKTGSKACDGREQQDGGWGNSICLQCARWTSSSD
jgi:hypothetical protein